MTREEIENLIFPDSSYEGLSRSNQMAIYALLDSRDELRAALEAANKDIRNLQDILFDRGIMVGPLSLRPGNALQADDERWE